MYRSFVNVFQQGGLRMEEGNFGDISRQEINAAFDEAYGGNRVEEQRLRDLRAERWHARVIVVVAALSLLVSLYLDEINKWVEGFIK